MGRPAADGRGFSAVVVTYNALPSLKRCLDALRRTAGDAERLVVVDNASRDGTRAFLRALAARRSRLGWRRLEVILNARNLGFSGAANRALRSPLSAWTIFIDDDARVGPGWRKRLLAPAARDPRIGVVGGRVVTPGGVLLSAEIVPGVAAVGCREPDRGQRNYVRTCEAVCGACLAVRREVFDRGARFDERFFPCQSEEVDFCLQARSLGFRVLYNGAVAIVHDHLFRGGDRLARNERLLREKWRSFEAFPSRDSHPADRAWMNAQRRLDERRFLAAIPWCRRLAAADPVPAYGLLHLGLAYLGIGRWREAARELGRAISDGRLHPDKQALGELALALAQRRRSSPKSPRAPRARRPRSSPRPSAAGLRFPRDRPPSSVWRPICSTRTGARVWAGTAAAAAVRCARR